MPTQAPAQQDNVDGEVDPQFCRLLQRHIPDADVHFQPGRDVRGQRVAPADVSADVTPDLPPIRLSIPLRLFPDNIASRLGQAEIELGDLRVDEETGAIWWRQRPVGAAVRDALIAVCEDAPHN